MRLLLTVTALLLIAACSSAPKKVYDPSAFAPVRTIELRDATDPLLLASTNAAKVREYLEVGLRHRGYIVCRECAGDAVATVTVREYSTQQQTKRNVLISGRVVMDVSESDWKLVVTRNGETIFQKRIEHDKTMPIDQLAARQVQDVLAQIPQRQ